MLDRKETLSQSERRLAAIMYTDMVGYTALGQRDESLSLATVEAQQKVLGPVLTRHGGRVVKTMGDAFLVEFTNALEGARCAYDIQRSVREFNLALTSEGRIHLRVGIHLGDVVEKEGDIFGDAVNVASRIEPLAEDGGVCLTQQVYDQVKNKMDVPLVSRGKVSLKGVIEPVEVYRMVMPWGEEKTVQPARQASNRIAVLPLVNMTNDPNEEYFVDGMTEEMISTLSNISGLTVISRTSAMQYKGAKKSLVDIGRELGAGTLMEGSVRKSGNRVRITVQLLDASEDKHLWAQSYDRELKDIFAVQSDVATNVADALKLRLLDRETAQIRKKHTESIEAYTIYLKGRSLWNRRDREGVLGSVKLFQEAIRIDPDYARAYAGLADAYSIAAVKDFMDRVDGLAKSKKAAVKALELDDALAEVHASLGSSLYDNMRYEEAQREFRRAIELNPSYATAHHWYHLCLQDMGRMKEATEEMERARELDPLSPVITLNVGLVYHLNGRLDEAITIFDKLIEKEPTYAPSYGGRAHCFLLKGLKERACADLGAWHKLGRDDDAYKYDIACLYGWFGEREKALPLIEELVPKVGKSSVWESDIADCYAVLGDREEFFRWIDRAISAKRIGIAGLRFCPQYGKVKEDPRFPEIFEKLGLLY
jgi:TolB-like protein